MESFRSARTRDAENIPVLPRQRDVTKRVGSGDGERGIRHREEGLNGLGLQDIDARLHALQHFLRAARDS